MCNNPIILIIIFIIKIIILVSLPLYILIVKEKSMRIIRYLVIINVVFISLFIILYLNNNSYIINSDLRGIVNTFKVYKYTDESVYLNNDPDIVETIITDKIYKNSKNENVYYFNHNELPLSDKKLLCDGKSLYMKQYGNNITAMSIMISELLDQNIDPIEILNKAYKDKIVDCNNGVALQNLLTTINKSYSANYRDITLNEIESNVSNGKLVLVESKYNKNAKFNITCSKGYFVIYNIDKEGKFLILNPNSTSNDYICPDNTVGALSIIEKDSNEKSLSLSEISEISTRFIILERN